MKLNFELCGVQLKEAEATSLLNIDETTRSLTVDLADHVDIALLDAKKLFSLSIEKQKPELAALAAKLAIKVPNAKIAKKKQPVERTAIPDLEVNALTIDEGIEKLCSEKTLCSAGAAMILKSCSMRDNETLRQIAVDHVNKLWIKDINPRSTVFNGFKKVNGLYMPFIARASKGTITYHSSPLYNSVREGASFLVKSGFVKAVAEVEFGSEQKELKGSETLLRRKVYRFTLTDAGRELINSWGDAEDFIFNYWNDRLN